MGWSRRDALKFLGGGVAGMLLSPIPWKLLRDSSVWTQNWPWTPVPARGPVTFRPSACTLCPHGCGTSVRCVGGRPVRVAAPATGGMQPSICSTGLAAHHLPWHPARLRSAMRREAGDGPRDFVPVDSSDAIRILGEAIRSAPGTVAYVAGRPGRALAAAWRDFVSVLPRGVVVASPAEAGSSLNVLRGLFATDPGPLVYDLEATRTLLGFGTPLLDGWAEPGLLEQRRSRGDLAILQFDSVQTRTAAKADRWVPIRPGTEGATALGLANRLLAKHPASRDRLQGESEAYLALVEAHSPARVRKMTGIEEGVLDDIADRLLSASPAVAVGGADPLGGPLPRASESAIQALNLILGSVGVEGGILPRPAPAVDDPWDAWAATPARGLWDLPEQSVSVLILDVATCGSALPRPLLASRMAPGGLVVSLSPWLADTALFADLVIPVAPPCTVEEDVPGHPEWPEHLRMASAFPGPETDRMDPVAFLNGVQSAAGVSRTATMADSLDDLISLRLAALQKRGEGRVRLAGEAEEVPLSDLQEDLRKVLRKGGVWRRDPVAAGSLPPVRLQPDDSWTFVSPTDEASSVDLAVRGSREQVSTSSRSPLLGKVDQESSTRLPPGRLAVNPETLARLGLSPGCTVTVETRFGHLSGTVMADPTVPPGCVVTGPASALRARRGARRDDDPLTVCVNPSRDSWRWTPASIREA